MPTVKLHTKAASPTLVGAPECENTLPELLQTPSGLAIVEIQGTINLPPVLPGTTTTPIGRLVFPLYDSNQASDDHSWQDLVHLYVGQHQRLTGQVKKLSKPIAVIRKRAVSGPDTTVTSSGAVAAGSDELEIVEIVHHKVLFSSRPEPVGS